LIKADVAYGDDERFVHRLEAFSDIVIGFSLAQLGLSFTVPAHMQDLFSKPIALLAFGVTFGLVCALWMRHHKWFAHYFVPTRLTVTLNFLLLGTIVVLVYALQLFVHFARSSTDDNILALYFYITTFASVFALFGIVHLVGIKQRFAALSPGLIASGYVQAFRQLGVAAGAVAFLVFAYGRHFEGRIYIMLPLLIVVFSGLGRMIGGRLSKQIAGPADSA